MQIYLIHHLDAINANPLLKRNNGTFFLNGATTEHLPWAKPIAGATGAHQPVLAHQPVHQCRVAVRSEKETGKKEKRGKKRFF